MSDYYPPPKFRVSLLPRGPSADKRDVSPAQAAMSYAAEIGEDGIYRVLRKGSTDVHRVYCQKYGDGWRAEYML